MIQEYKQFVILSYSSMFVTLNGKAVSIYFL